MRENVRTKETNLGNLCADAIRNETKSNIAFVNGGNIRTTLKYGKITKGKLAELFPFGNTIKVIKLTGEDIIKALEVSVGAYPQTSGGFLQVSGITFSVNVSKEKGSRVSIVKVNGEDIDLTKEYTVAINDFLAQGGDGYDMFKTKIVAEFGTDEKIFTKYLNINGTKGCEVSRRITIKETKKSSFESEKGVTTNEIVYTVRTRDILGMIAYKNNKIWKKLV